MHKHLKVYANKEGSRTEGKLQTINIQGQDKRKREEKRREEKRREEKRKDKLTVLSNKEDVDYFTSNSFHFMVDVLFVAAIFLRGWPVCYQNQQ